MSIIEILTFLPIIIVLMITLVLMMGFLLIPKGQINKKFLPKVCIIISARNEEKDLPICIQSIEQLTYPKEKLQVILVDDRSTDRTPQIIEEANNKNPHFLSVTTSDYKGHLEAKARGLHCGILHADAEWIFISDADATLPHTWIESMLTGVDERTACIAGPLNVPSTKLRGIIEKLAYALALPYAYGYSFLFSPLFCIGPNMAIKKSVYDKAGGLAKAKFKIAEDLALFKMAKDVGMKVLYHADANSLIQVSPVPSISHVKSQLMRWVGGAFEHGWKFSSLIFSWLLFFFISSCCLFFSPLWLDFDLLISLWIIKIISDTIALVVFISKTRAKNVWMFIPLSWFFAPVIFFLLPIGMVFRGKITWKGTGYKITYPS